MLLPKLFRSIAANGSSASAVAEVVVDFPVEAVAGLVEAGLAEDGLGDVGWEAVGFADGCALLVGFPDEGFALAVAESDLVCPAGFAGAFSENSAEQLPHFTRLSTGIDLISMGCLHFGHCSVGIQTTPPYRRSSQQQ